MSQEPKKKRKFWPIAIIIIVIAVIGYSLNSGGSDDKDSSDSSAKTEQSASKKSEAPKETATPVTFEEMSKDYLANGKVADDKYKGKLLEFSGKVTKITDGVFSGSDVEIEAGNFTDDSDDFKYRNTEAIVHIKDDEIVKKLVSGETYTFQAKGNGANIATDYVYSLDFKDGTVK